jgi:maltooligosyltrehalose trehalohydrolase
MDNGTSLSAGVSGLGDDSVRWRVWAPRARRVELVLIDGDKRRAIPMSAEEHGFFTRTEPRIPKGQRYAYRLDGGPERPDPASLWQPDGVHRPSAVVRPERFSWSDHAWQGFQRQDLVFYELHVGTFTPEGTFEAIIPRLPQLRELGITALELLPVAQFPGTRNWGYDGVHLFAPQNSYGGPLGLQRLVDACHAADLAVFLDVVYNHLGPEGNYLGEFGPYFTERYRTAWGPAFNYDSAGCDPVRAFILDNVRMWIAGYHVDGLRIDAVHAIYDAAPRHILRDIKETADMAARSSSRSSSPNREGVVQRHVHVIAESNLNDVRLLQAPERGGYGLDAQWNDDFHHVVHSYLTGERQGYYGDFGEIQHFTKLFEKTFVLDGTYSRFRDRRHGAPAYDMTGDRFVISIQNHDQIGNRARGDRLSTMLRAPAQRLAASLMLLAPHLPLLFMGEEYGEEHPFLFFCSFLDAHLVEQVRKGRREEFAEFAWQGEVPDPQAESSFADSRLTWSWPEGSHRAGLRRLYRDLLAGRRTWPALRDFQRRSACLVPETDPAVLQVIRGGTTPTPGTTLQIHFNLTDKRQPVPSPTNGDVVLFSSEAKQYGGERTDLNSPGILLPYECLVFGSANWEKPT